MMICFGGLLCDSIFETRKGGRRSEGLFFVEGVSDDGKEMLLLMSDVSWGSSMS